MTRELDRIQKNANRYIVKNCPAFGDMASECYLAEIKPCYECPDCITKRVIEKCKEYITVLEMHKHNTKDCGFDNILQLFDIEEINK